MWGGTVVIKCPKCVKEGKKSCVRIGHCTTTVAFYAPFYDEKGFYHHHNSNNKTQYYTCTEGHSWSAHEPNTCPNPERDWTNESRAAAPPEIKEDTSPLNQITGNGGSA
jgi:hypothetical protein